MLADLLTPQVATEVQSAAISRLSQIGDIEAGDTLLEKWNSLTPPLRRQLIDVLISRNEWAQKLLDAAKTADIPLHSINATGRQRLKNSSNDTIRSAAETLFSSLRESTRSEVLKRYAGVHDMTGDIQSGKQHFARVCSKCHQLEGVGHVVGPDLLALTDKSSEAMLTAILDPNRAIEDKYLGYVAITNDGRQFSGLLASETSTSIKLKMDEGKERDILRSNIEELMATGKSHMPEGLESEVTPEQVADIVAYVRSVSIPHRQFAGNSPQIAPVRDDGSIRLFAMHAKIFGKELEFEPKYRNLGMWSQAGDRAVWQLDVPKGGEYSVQLDYACDRQCAGNRFQLSANGQKLIAELPVTDGWDSYSTRKFGRLTLPEGPVEVTLRSEGQINQFLGDFRTVILEPW